MRLGFQKGDVAAIASIMLLAALVFILFLPREDTAAYAEIYQNGKLIKTVSLDADQEFTISGKYSNTITVQDGKVAVTHSNCPGEDCVSCGWMDDTGRSIACLPNGLEIRVVAENSNVDFAVG